VTIIVFYDSAFGLNPAIPHGWTDSWANGQTYGHDDRLSKRHEHAKKLKTSFSEKYCVKETVKKGCANAYIKVLTHSRKEMF